VARIAKYGDVEKRIEALIGGDTDEQTDAGEELRDKFRHFQVVEELRAKLVKSIELFPGAGMDVKIEFRKEDLYRFVIALARVCRDLELYF